MVRFLHTADIQLGMRATEVPEVAEKIREQRLETLKRIVALAKQEKVDFVLIAGDLFEDNQVTAVTAHRASAALAEAAPVPVYLLPGNHDPLTPDSVYRRSMFREQRPDNIVVLDSEEPVSILSGRCVLYPCPAGARRSPFDPTAGLRTRVRKSTDSVGIGAAHGSLMIEGRFSPDDHPIGLDAGPKAGVDYLALGHWHNHYRLDAHTAYPGTPEQTSFGERDSGQVLLVSIETGGAAPDLELCRVGALRWATWEEDLTPGPGEVLDGVRRKVRALDRADNTMLRLVLKGTAPVDSLAVVEDFAEWLHAQNLLYVDIRREVVPTEIVISALGRLADQDSALAGTLADLRALATLAAVGADTGFPLQTDPLPLDELLAVWNAIRGTEAVDRAAAANEALIQLAQAAREVRA